MVCSRQVAHTTPETRAEGLVRALVAAGKTTQSRSIFGAWFSSTRTPDVDLSTYWIQPSAVNPRIPSNLYLVASAGDSSWGAQHTGITAASSQSTNDADLPVWARQRSTDWWPAAQQLKRALASLPGDWCVFADTDHLCASPLTKLALGAMDRTVVPVSLDGGDFSRLFHDVTGNALFTDVMMPMASQGMLGAPVCTFVFTKMTSNQNAPNETKEGIRSPFTPAQAVQRQMGDLAASLREAAQHHPLLQASIRGYTEAAAAVAKTFGRNYFTAFKTVSDVSLDASKKYGAPLCTMDCTDRTLGDIKAAQTVVKALQVELTFLLDVVLREPINNEA